jgi:predicted glycosyltransferase
MSKQYIFYYIEPNAKLSDILELVVKTTSKTLLAVFNNGNSVKNYFKHNSTHRFFKDVEPDSALQQWLINGKEIEFIALHNHNEIKKVHEYLKNHNIVAEIGIEDRREVIVTEPLSEEDYINTINNSLENIKLI